MLSTKSKKASKWYSTDKPVSPLNLGRCFKYPSGNLLSILGSCKEIYIALIIGWKEAIFGDDDKDESVWDV